MGSDSREVMKTKLNHSYFHLLVKSVFLLLSSVILYHHHSNRGNKFKCDVYYSGGPRSVWK